MNRLDPTSLKLFVRVAEEGTIAAAAESEHIAPAAVSKRLSELEAAMGTRLLIRNNKGVAPTDAGHALLALARRALHELDQIPAQMAGFASGVRGIVRVGASLSALTQFLPADLQAFRRRYPDVELQLQERISSAVTRAVSEDSADLGIYTAAVHGDELESHPYRSDRLVLCVAPAHPLARQESVRFAEILGEDIVGMHTGSAMAVLMDRAASLAGRPARPRIQVTSFDAQCMMVSSGFGVGLAPETVARRNAAALDLRIVRLAEDWAEREFRICVRRGGPASVAARVLLEHLRNCAQALPGPSP